MNKESVALSIKQFLDNIVYLRKKSGLSKKEMTKILGISIGTLNKTEKGDIPPLLKAEIVFNVSDYFNISTEDLFRKLSD